MWSIWALSLYNVLSPAFVLQSCLWRLVFIKNIHVSVKKISVTTATEEFNTSTRLLGCEPERASLCLCFMGFGALMQQMEKTIPQPWSINCMFQSAHTLEFIAFCVLPWHIMERHWHFPRAISHKQQQNNANKSSVSLRLSQHYTLLFPPKITIWMLTVEHNSLPWTIVLAAYSRAECREVGFVASCFISAKFFKMLRAVY